VTIIEALSRDVVVTVFSIVILLMC